MDRKISFGQYRAIDLSILTALMVFSELLIFVAVKKWFGSQLYSVSPQGGLIALVMMRWGAWAAVPAFIGGALYSVLYGSGLNHFLIYAIGNLLSLGMLLMLSKCGKEKVRENVTLSVVFGLGVQVLMELGRGLVSLLLGYTISQAFGFIASDALSIIFTLVIIWIVRQIDGLFEDQKHYLLRLQEQEKEGGEQP